ncbi:hypothetical protein ABT404_40480 [Streptomyces hyaluromycini]|uniref:Phage protein D n=1 Tax=Streptomyces hyaluromycini TaxID=1377993 RepID=A0ABV1X9K8_9ACTN
MLSGSTKLTVLLGPSVPVPAPAELVRCIEEVRVTSSADARSGFQLVLGAGRDRRTGLVDFPQLTGGRLRAFHRVVLIVTTGGRPLVLMDGVITHRELTSGTVPGSTRLTVTGEDVSVMMDLEEKSAAHPAQDEAAIATRLILGYPRYGLVPKVIPPPVVDPPLPIDRTPVQQGTDLAYLTAMARRFGYVFYVTPGPAPLVNTAYWGPPRRVGPPAPALTVGRGPAANVQQITFRSDPLAPVRVSGSALDPLSDAVLPVRGTGSLRPPLATAPDWAVNLPNVRTVAFRESGPSAVQAAARAQGTAEASNDALVATGTLDTLRYGTLLTAGGLVGVRGAGWEHDGLYYVRQVTHALARGRHTQQFTLSREGTGSTVPLLPPPSGAGR